MVQVSASSIGQVSAKYRPSIGAVSAQGAATAVPVFLQKNMCFLLCFLLKHSYYYREAGWRVALFTLATLPLLTFFLVCGRFGGR